MDSSTPTLNDVAQTKYLPYRPALATKANELDSRTAPYRWITVRFELIFEEEHGRVFIATPDVKICTRQRGLVAMATAFDSMKRAFENVYKGVNPTLSFWHIDEKDKVGIRASVYITNYTVMQMDTVSMKIVEVSDEVPFCKAIKAHPQVYWHAMERSDGCELS